MQTAQARQDENLEHQNRHDSDDGPLDIAAQATPSALFATTPQHLAVNQSARSPFQSSSPHVRNGRATATPAIGSNMTQDWVTEVSTALPICSPALGIPPPFTTAGTRAVVQPSINALTSAFWLQRKTPHAELPIRRDW